MQIKKSCPKTVFIFVVFLSSFMNLSFAQELIWSDEFDGTSLDTDTWDQPEYNRRNNDNGPDGWWLQEDAYIDGAGNLVIRVKQIENRNSDDDPIDYSTGAIRTKGNFEQKFGKFEIRCKLPTQPGWWVAFWLYSPSVSNEDGSGEDGTEIDIFEGFGWTDRVQHALHWDGYGDAHQSTSADFTMEGIREGFHTFTLEWYHDIYIFFIDGVESWRTDDGGVSKVPAYVKVTGELSTEPWAINSWWANDPQTTSYPDSFLVDYVRVYTLYDTISTGIHIESNAVTLPDGPALIQNYPNPFNARTVIQFKVQTASDVTIFLMDIQGRWIRDLYHEATQPGNHSVHLDATNLPSGLYLVRIAADDIIRTAKLVLTK